ncbi:MAG TPA: 5-bromo-4-chloroindolyl phosphate hydrolysis family protein [Candidatus Eisenbergiella stercoravium]|nr:5-bromo-4-chloroindolyl phosphate hydrolysis family protein [Candidatus Eisenbergiella stercoravium]
MKKEGIRSLLTGAAASVFFLILFLGLGWSFLVSLLLAVLLFAAVWLITKPERKGENAGWQPDDQERELLRSMKEARKDFESIRRSMGRIRDRQLRQQTEGMCRAAGNILAYLEKHPEKIPAARRFIDYYQETASTLLARYVELESAGLSESQTQVLTESMKRAAAALTDAFQKQLGKMVENEVTDMEADVDVLEQMMRMEGLK